MNRYALLICAGMLALTLGTCSQTADLRHPPPSPTIMANCTRADIEAKVFGLTGQNGRVFNAAEYGACIVRQPNCSALGPRRIPLTELRFARAIGDAFDIAPDKFKNELCRLETIYVDNQPGSPNSSAWGMRQETTANAATHVAISPAGLAPAGPNSYAKYETDILQSLLNWQNGPSYSNAVNDSPALRTLAILAHEIGHIVWWRDQIASRTCGHLGRFPITWTDFAIPRGFHGFGQALGTPTLETFNYTQIVNDVNGNRPRAVQELETIYGFPPATPRWADLFAFVAPDEDFIETYKFWVLTNARLDAALTRLDITIPGSAGGTRDIISNFNDPNGVLFAKKNWIGCYIDNVNPLR